MPKRRNVPAPKAGFIKDIIAGSTPRQAALANLPVKHIPAKPFNKGEVRELNQHLLTAEVDRAMRDEAVTYAILDRLRQYQATWADLESATRAVLAKHLSGVGLEDLDLQAREAFAAAAARAVLMALAKNNPEAFSDAAKREDQARLSPLELARRIVGEPTRLTPPPPTEAPAPEQEHPS